MNYRIYVSDDDISFWEENKVTPAVTIDSMRDVLRVFVNGQSTGDSSCSLYLSFYTRARLHTHTHIYTRLYLLLVFVFSALFLCLPFRVPFSLLIESLLKGWILKLHIFN